MYGAVEKLIEVHQIAKWKKNWHNLYEINEEIQQIIKKNEGCITVQLHEQWLHIQANESSWPRTHTPWQRCTPHSAAATKTDDLCCPFQSITWWAGEGQSVTNPKAEPNSVTILRNSRIFTRFEVIFCKLGGEEDKWQSLFRDSLILYNLDAVRA